MAITNTRLTDKEFERDRKAALSLWPTGKEVDIDEAVEFHKTLLPERNTVMKFAEAKRKGKTLIRVSSGTALLDDQITLLKALQDEGGADILECHCDSLTRNLRFEEAQRALDESIRQGRSLLNGYPVVNHGVKNARLRAPRPRAKTT